MTTQTPLFSGSIVALVTPMDNHGNIDFETLEKLIEFHINAGTEIGRASCRERVYVLV